MFRNKRLRARRQKVLARIAQRPARPWDHVKADACWNSRLRLRKLFALGMSDAEIAKIMEVDPGIICLVRPNKHRWLSNVSGKGSTLWQSQEVATRKRGNTVKSLEQQLSEAFDSLITAGKKTFVTELIAETGVTLEQKLSRAIDKCRELR